MAAGTHVPPEFHEALGRALANWQYVETSLFVLSHGLLETKFERTSVVYFHIQSQSAKLQLIDKMLRLERDGVWIKENWKPMLKRTQNAIHLRNALAHFEVVQLDERKSGAHTSLPFAVTPHRLDVMSSQSGQVKALFVEKLDEVSNEFGDLTKALFLFSPSACRDWEVQLERLPPDIRRVVQKFLAEDS